MASGGHDQVKAVSPALPLPSRQSMRSNNSPARGPDSTRKQPLGSGDNQNRKSATPPLKAWQGPNPITSRSNNLPNGIDRSSQKPSTANMDTQAHDRLLFLLANMTGLDTTITMKSGEQYAGILSGGSFDGSSKAVYTLKMAKKTRQSDQQPNGASDHSNDYVGEGDDHTLSIDMQDTLSLNVSNVTLGLSSNNGPASSFRTDTEISRNVDQSRERTLQRWEPGPSDMSLDDLALEDSGTNGWDQFKANEQKYGVSSTYDMDMYTSTIDKSHPQYAKRLANADRIAREIEGSTATNSHVAEERQQNVSHEEGGDEEDKYSGVKRDNLANLSKGGSGSYVPPSRRPITSAPTVPGAPYDPAIISSQLARPSQPSADAKKSEDKSAASPTSGDSASASTPTSLPKASPNTTEGHVRDTADAFKQFANTEKLRIRQAQEQKRTNARNEKNVRINDLKKFAENFKLKSRVPDDLVPILAKNHDKQQEIRRKAEEAAQAEEGRTKDKPASVSPAPSTAREPAAVTPQQAPRTKQAQNRNHFVPQPLPGMSPRQAQVFKGAAGRGLVPPQQMPTNVPTGPAAQQEVVSPSAGSRLSMSAKAFEFRPAASTFMPSGVSPSPQRSTTESTTPAAPESFFDEKEKANLGKHDHNMDEDSDVIVWLQTAGVASLTDDQKKSLVSLGGVPQPYRTPPTWNVPQERANVMYEDAFGKVLVPELPMMHMGGQLPHAHQLPPHMHGNMSAQQARYFQQPPLPQGYDPRMQYTGGPGSSLQSSPRFPHAQVTLGQMPQFMGMPQFAGQNLQYAGMSPNLAFRQPHGPANGNPMMMVPGQPHGPMTPMRGYSQGQHFPNMPGQMMQGQPSPYANGQGPQQPYSPLPHNAQPHMQHMGQPGFNASPRPGPHMMHHTGSHQGFQPHQMAMAYAQMPGQGSPYAMNQRQMSAGHFPQMTPRQTHAMPANQSQPSPSPALATQNAGKNDEGK